MPVKAIPAAYIFLGPELGKKNEAIDSLRKKLTAASAHKDRGSPPEETVFYAGETSVRIIASRIQNHSLFADKRLFIVKGAELIEKKGEIELIVDTINNLDDGTALILLSDETRLAAGLDGAVPKENRQVFYELFDREKTAWLHSFFKIEGFLIHEDGIQCILEMVENNTEALRRECSRLVGFLSKHEPITADVIEKWLSHNREESAIMLFSRIAAGDTGKALESMRTLLAAKKPPQKILSDLAFCFRKLQMYITLAKNGEVNSFELKKIGLYTPKTKEDYAAAARIYNSTAAEACLALTAEYDVLLRSPVSVMEDVLMDRYILGICRLAR